MERSKSSRRRTSFAKRAVKRASVWQPCLLFVLDPDGDIVRYLKRTGRARREEAWACRWRAWRAILRREMRMGPWMRWR